MMYIYACLVLLGFLPMAIVLYKKYKTDKLQKHGTRTLGIVREIYGYNPRMINRVLIEFPVQETGKIISKKINVAGIPYNVGDQIPLFYDPKRPHNIRLDYKKGFIPMLVFTLLIAGFVIWACIKIQKAVAAGEM